jgi:HK97 family phage prohead protease
MTTFDCWLQRLSVADEGGTFSGIAATVGERAVEGSTFAAGAWAATLAEHAARGTRPAMLLDHLSSAPIGAWKSITETPAGLAVEGRVTSATEKGRETRQLLREGVITGLSVGFIVPEGGGSRDAKGNRTITRASLIEISLTAVPALAGARVREVRSFSTAREAEEALREAGFSKTHARALMAKGWRGITGDEGPSADEIMAAIKRIEAATSTLKVRS